MTKMTGLLAGATGGLLLSSLWSFSASAQSVEEVQALVEDGLTRGMSISVVGRLTNARVTVSEGDNNDFDVRVTGADLYEVSLPDVLFSIAKGEGPNWNVSDGRLASAVDYRGGNGRDEASLASFEWSGTWNAEHNEYMGLSLDLGKFRLQSREFGMEIESLGLDLSDQNPSNGEITTDYAIGAISFSFGIDSAIGQSLEGVPSDMSGTMAAVSSRSTTVAQPGYRPFQWLALLSDAVGEAEVLEEDVAKQAAYMRAFVQSLFQSIDSSETVYKIDDYTVEQLIEGSLMNSNVRLMTGTADLVRNDDGTIKVVSRGDAEDYQISGQVPEIGGSIDIVLKRLLGDFVMHNFDAASIESILLSLIDRYESGELEEPLPSDIIGLVQSIGGMSIYQAVEKLSAATDFMGPVGDVGLMAFDMKIAAPLEDEARLESRYGLAIEGFSTPFAAMHPLGPVVVPSKAVVNVGLQHDGLSAMLEKADLTEEESDAFYNDIDFWEDDNRNLPVFLKLWNGSEPTFFGNVDLEGPGYSLQVEWKGNVVLGPPASPYDPPSAVGQVDIIVKGLDTVQGKLAEMSQMELDPESQQFIFGATAGLGMAMGFGRPTDDGRTRFLIEFEAPDSITVNGMQLPFM